MKKSRPVRSTYRVQLTPGFGFDKTAELAPYLAELGVSHLYASPYLQSAKGSTHGYDVADYSAVNVDLGGLEAHRRMCDALERNGLGQILDIVPNHMSTSPRNAWWWDVLEHGRKSRYASYFDIFWGDAPNAKILVPVLGDRYGKVLAAGELELVRDGQAIVVRYFEHRFPVSPASARALLEAAKVPRLDARFEGELDRVLAEVSGDPEKLDRVLTAQHYRLAFWRLAATDLNYRCFFDINKLIGVKQEDPTVFEASHALALGWLNDGTLDGVRIDHIDGIRDPRTYLERLHERAPRAWVVVEKILESGETLPRDWPIAGTTGYEFLNAVTGLFIDPAGEAPMTDVYQQFAETDARFDEIVYEKKRYILADKFQSEIGRLADLLATCCSADYRFRDTRKDELKAVLHEVIAAFPVYRTYARRDHAGHAELAEQEERFVRQAFAAVAERRPQIDEVLRGFLQEILLCERRGPVETELVLQMQQLTGPVMAKGVEDTAFYVYYRLLALNEVGGDPEKFGVTPSEFHDFVASRKRLGASMLANSTHDTKRSEDVRARLAVLSEIPATWASAVVGFSKLAERFKQDDIPDANVEYLFWQTVIGAHPIDPDRVARYMLKACREAKGRTAWVRPDAAYEDAVIGFVKSALADAELVEEIGAFARALVEPGRVNALSQKLITLTAPGVPDIYQGTELWDLSLVDPDNRHPVSFELRRALLRELPSLSLEQIRRRADEGLPKLWLVSRALDVRRRRPELFDAGASYEPLFADGARRDHVVAFVRAGASVTIVPRFVVKLQGDWQGTSVSLPPGGFENVLTGERWSGTVRIAELLARFPVALLERSP